MIHDLKNISKKLTEFIRENEKEMSEDLRIFVLTAKDQLARAALLNWKKNNVIQFPRLNNEI